MNTILLVECSGSGIHWMEPRDLSADRMSFAVNDKSRIAPRSKHRGGCNVLLCDGTVAFIEERADPAILRAASIIGGGEDTDLRNR